MQIQTHSRSNPQAAIERTSDDAVAPAETRARRIAITPPVDIFENEEELLLVTDLPGVAKEAVRLDLDRRVLSLEAVDDARHRVYRRAFTLPDAIDPAGVRAVMKNGVLTVHLRKREDMKPRRVEVRSS